MNHAIISTKSCAQTSTWKSSARIVEISLSLTMHTHSKSRD